MFSPIAKRIVPKAYGREMDRLLLAENAAGRMPPRWQVVRWHNHALDLAAKQTPGLLLAPFITQTEGMALFLAFLDRHGLTYKSFSEVHAPI